LKRRDGLAFTAFPVVRSTVILESNESGRIEQLVGGEK
jgi:hypothetical protein